MRVRIVLDVDARMRYVISKYFAPAATEARDKTRTRATRRQVQTFVKAALCMAVRDREAALRGRARARAARLADPNQPVRVEVVLPLPAEPELPWE